MLSLHSPSLQCPGYAKQLGSPDSSLPLSLLPGSKGLPYLFFQSLGDPDIQKSKCGKVVLPSDLWGEHSLPLPVSSGLRDPQVYGSMVSTSAWVFIWPSLPRCLFFAVFQKVIAIGFMNHQKGGQKLVKYESALWPLCACHDSQTEVEDSFYTEGPNRLPGAPMTQPSQEILSLPRNM